MHETAIRPAVFDLGRLASPRDAEGVGKAVLAVACALLWSAGAAAQDGASIATVATFPPGTFLENLSAGPDGALLFTSYLDRTLLTWTGTGAPSVLATLDVHPAGILSRPGDIVVSAHGASFTEGPAFTATNAMLVLGRDGAVLRRVDVPDALFLYGLVELAPDSVLVADSLGGRIWRFDPTAGTIAPWLDDPALAVAPDATDQRPGANGLKVHEGWLYVSNSSRGTIDRVRLDGTAPAGSLERFAATGPVDDFAFLPDGTIAAATHGARLIRVGADGAVSDIMDTGCDGCTSVAAFGPDGALAVLTTGNLLEGGTGEARLLTVTLTE